jgi:hypothetical protein
MMLKALIVEQLDTDGILRTFRMQPSVQRQDIVVAFADEYEDTRFGPFHFLDEDDAKRFEEGFARCRVRKIGSPHFRFDGHAFHVELTWAGIPTERNWLSYYALSLPEFAIPKNLSITDPHRPGREYKRAIRRDDQRHRYVVYLECSSTLGRFDFDISCDFVISKNEFARSEYKDSKTSQDGPEGDDWQHWLNNGQRQNVTNFFVKGFHMGDNYSAGQAGAMGPGAQASNMTFQQIWNQTQGSVDLQQLARELERLNAALRSEAKEPEHQIAIGAVSAAEAEAKRGNGPKALEYLKKAGAWAFDVATKIGVNVASGAMKSVLGMP